MSQASPLPFSSAAWELRPQVERRRLIRVVRLHLLVLFIVVFSLPIAWNIYHPTLLVVPFITVISALIVVISLAIVEIVLVAAIYRAVRNRVGQSQLATVMTYALSTVMICGVIALIVLELMATLLLLAFSSADWDRVIAHDGSTWYSDQAYPDTSCEMHRQVGLIFIDKSSVTSPSCDVDNLQVAWP